MKKNAFHIRHFIGSRIFDFVNYAFFTLFCLFILFPFWDLIVKSFSRAQDVSIASLNLWPKNLCFDSYKYCFGNRLIGIGFRNTILRTILASTYHLLVCSLAAFALTRTEMPLRKPVTLIFLITMFFSGGLIPTYLNMKNLGLTNKFWVYVIPGGFSMYDTIIIRNYFFSIDRSMEESASIDGASMLQVLFKIILPLSTPVLATVGLWQLVGNWNAWFDNLIYVKSDNLITLQYLLRRMTVNISDLTQNLNSSLANTLDQVNAGSYTSETIIAATTVIILFPIMCTYPFLQKFFVKGIMLGAVKG